MHKSRLEAFSDGVFAILITIMVLELKVPTGNTWESLFPLSHIFLSYVLSFIYLGIYWNNHHHLLQITKSIHGVSLWANTHLLFWLSLIPFITAWNGESNFSGFPVTLYGFILLMCGFAYWVLVQVLVKKHGKNSDLAKALGSDLKGKASLILYFLAILVSFWFTSIAIFIYIIVAIMWLIPDGRIEKKLLPTI